MTAFGVQRARWVGICALAACSTSAGRGTTSSGPGTDAGAGDAGAELCTPYDAGWVTAGELDAGNQLLQTFGCQKCHGALLTGNNDGIRDPHSDDVQYPPNLSPDQATGLGCWTDGQIQNAILNDVDNQGSPICQPMPSFADAGMTIEDVTAIIAYLRVAVHPFVNGVPSGPGCCMFDLDCGDDGDCDQRECVDGGAPKAGTSGTSTGRPTGSSVSSSTAGTSSTGGSRTGASAGTTGGSTSAGLATSSTTGTSAASGTSVGGASAISTTGTGSTAGTSGSRPGSSTSGDSTSTGATSSGSTSAASTGSPAATSTGTTGS